jgi:hypothetical protein
VPCRAVPRPRNRVQMVSVPQHHNDEWENAGMVSRKIDNDKSQCMDGGVEVGRGGKGSDVEGKKCAAPCLTSLIWPNDGAHSPLNLGFDK